MPSPRPLGDDERDELEALLDAVPAPFEPLDASMLDGFLCGVLVQPRRVGAAAWLPHITDVDGRALPARFDATRLHQLALRRHAELDDAIGRRHWFDPWVFELADDDGDDDVPARADVETHVHHQHDDDGLAGDDEEEDDMDGGAVDAVYPWVAGFATALELFPELMAMDAKALTAPLALVYRHLAPDDLEDADELLAEIESLVPPEDLADAVEGLVRATLLLADIGRPLSPGPGAKRPAPRQSGPHPLRRRGPSDR